MCNLFPSALEITSSVHGIPIVASSNARLTSVMHQLHHTLTYRGIFNSTDSISVDCTSVASSHNNIRGFQELQLGHVVAVEVGRLQSRTYNAYHVHDERNERTLVGMLPTGLRHISVTR